MCQTEDQLDSGEGITDLIFDARGSVIRDYRNQKIYTSHKIL